MLTSRCILIPRDGISRSLKKPERERAGGEREKHTNIAELAIEADSSSFKVPHRRSWDFFVRGNS